MSPTYAGIGARATPPEILELMREIAAALAARGYVLRTGGASGADETFLEGAVAVSGQVELFLPWPGFRGWHAQRHVRLFERPSHEAYALAQQHHPNWSNLRHSVRSLHARNCHQVLGAELNNPVAFVLCWTPGGRYVGGTAQALRIATAHHIPVLSLADPMARQRVRGFLDRSPASV